MKTTKQIAVELEQNFAAHNNLEFESKRASLKARWEAAWYAEMADRDQRLTH